MCRKVPKAKRQWLFKVAKFCIEHTHSPAWTEEDFYWQAAKAMDSGLLVGLQDEDKNVQGVLIADYLAKGAIFIHAFCAGPKGFKPLWTFLKGSGLVAYGFRGDDVYKYVCIDGRVKRKKVKNIF
jgi:hypothetical protein